MFWDNFELLCNRINKSPSKVCAELGLSNSIATAWKGGATPRPKIRSQIAEYFGVSESELFATEALSPNEKRLLEAANGFSDHDIDELIAYAAVIRTRNAR